MHPYVHETTVEQWLLQFNTKLIGHSFLGKPIRSVHFGNGPIRVLVWSQMHGNESTGLRAMMELLTEWASHKSHSPFDKLTIVYIPQLNPDGAEKWTRRNAQEIDLNRDLRAKQSPEIECFVRLLDAFRPDIALNLHDQRTFFSQKGHGESSSLALAVPEASESLSADSIITSNRRFLRHYILQMYNSIKPSERRGWSVFDESYYPRSIGEYVQESGCATLLVESGVVGTDLSRSLSVQQAKSFLKSFLSGLSADKLSHDHSADTHLDGIQAWPFPRNEQGLVDLKVQNAQIQCYGKSWETDLAIWLKDAYQKGKPCFIPILHDVGDLRHLNSRVALERVEIRVESEELIVGFPITFWPQLKGHTPWADIEV